MKGKVVFFRLVKIIIIQMTDANENGPLFTIVLSNLNLLKW